MDFCSKCGARLVPKKMRVEEEKPKYTKVWEYGKGWRLIEPEKVIIFMMACPKCGYKRRAKQLKSVDKVKPTPLPDMPLGSRRYYPSYMSPNEYFRDEMRQADVVESITRSAPAKRAEKRKHARKK